MYNYYKIEVLEDFTIERKLRKLQGEEKGFIVVERMKKGEVIHSLHGIDTEYRKAINEGKIKILETK